MLYSTRLLHSLAFYVVGLFLVTFGWRLRDLQTQMASKRIIPLSQTWSKLKETYYRGDALACDLRLINCVALMFSVFINLKHLIPLINPHLLDRKFAGWEMSLFDGQTVGEHLQLWLGADAAYYLSPFYTFFYTYVALILYYIIFTKRYAQEFLALFCLLWFLGVLTVYAVPTWGPIFFVPELYSALPHTVVTDLQQRLIDHQQYLALHPYSEKGVYLISGFPSLHLAVPILGSIYLWRLNRLIGGLSWSFVIITILTTLYFGWHWLADDLGSVLLVGILLLMKMIIPTRARSWSNA